jgi:hypothetical protein
MLQVELSEPIQPTIAQRLIEKLAETHRNAIPIFGVALWIDGVEELVACLPNLIDDVKFYGWHETPADACRRLCRLCFIDPALIECYIGMKFEQLVA